MDKTLRYGNKYQVQSIGWAVMDEGQAECELNRK
jgi:hypothetical protein